MVSQNRWRSDQKHSMNTANNIENKQGAAIRSYPLLTALRERRSRRFGLGMKIPAGPLAYESKHKPRPLTEDEEAALVFAACGITEHALADLCYAKGGGGGIMAGLVARTIARAGRVGNTRGHP